MLGVGHDDELDVADPVGLGRRGRTSAPPTCSIDLLGEVVDLAFPVRTRAEGQPA